MLTIPNELQKRFHGYGQEHVFAWWDQIDDPQRQELLKQLQAQQAGLFDMQDVLGLR